MFETGIRQFRLAMSMVWGKRYDVSSLERLVRDAVSTVEEFGELGLQARELIESPFDGPEDRDDHARRSLRRTARRLNRLSPFYAERFAAAHFDPDRMDLDTVANVPVTTKEDLMRRGPEFVCRGSRGSLATRTTGTTGRAVELWLSEYELGLCAGLSALSAVLHDELHGDDVMQVHISSRATAAVHLTAATCQLVGAGCVVLGIIDADEALDRLLQGSTLLSANPSYLAELLVAARRRGLSSNDFGLRRIDCAGEILSRAVRDAAESTFGARVFDNFGMTEVIPVSATTCSAGHLHHDLTMGHVEIVDLHSGEPASPGELGTAVLTPYFPYRETMPVFRYDTRDLVRKLDDQLQCEQAALPATSAVLGKADHLIAVGGGDSVTPRDVVEAVEALPSRPWPARYRATGGDQLLLELPRQAVDGLTASELTTHFTSHGLHARVEVVPDMPARVLRPLRCDLRELSFAHSVPIGA